MAPTRGSSRLVRGGQPRIVKQKNVELCHNPDLLSTPPQREDRPGRIGTCRPGRSDVRAGPAAAFSGWAAGFDVRSEEGRAAEKGELGKRGLLKFRGRLR